MTDEELSKLKQATEDGAPADAATVLALIDDLETTREELANVEDVMGVRQNHYREEIARLKAENAELRKRTAAEHGC